MRTNEIGSLASRSVVWAIARGCLSSASHLCHLFPRNRKRTGSLSSAIRLIARSQLRPLLPNTSTSSKRRNRHSLTRAHQRLLGCRRAVCGHQWIVCGTTKAAAVCKWPRWRSSGSSMSRSPRELSRSVAVMAILSFIGFNKRRSKICRSWT